MKYMKCTTAMLLNIFLKILVLHFIHFKIFFCLIILLIMVFSSPSGLGGGAEATVGSNEILPC